jgi:hypothetical protein
MLQETRTQEDKASENGGGGWWGGAVGGVVPGKGAFGSCVILRNVNQG